MSAGADQQLLVSLINTLHVPDGDDQLEDERARSWLLDHGATGERVEQFGLDSLRQLREGLRELALANNNGEADEDVVARARTSISALPMSVQLGDFDDGPSIVAPAGAGPAQQVIARTFNAYLGERARGSWRRIKACAAPDCHYAYLDTSRNISRRWCDMAECGNRAKNRTWRTRRASTRK